MKQTTITLSRGYRSFCLLLITVLLFMGNAALGQTIAGWNPTGLSGFGPNPFAPTTTNANLTVTGLTRGAGLTTTGTAAGGGWGGTGWADNQATDDFTWTMTANSGYQQSLTSISFCYRRSGTGPNLMTFQYALNGGAYTDIIAVSCTSTATTPGAMMPAINLSGIPALQNVPAGTVINFRITGAGSTNAGGTFYVYAGTAGTPGMNISGTVTAAPACTAPAGLSATNSTAAAADLSWNTVSGATGYEYVVDQAAGSPAGAGTATTATTFSPTGLTASTVYYLHVRTNCGSGNFSPWTTISFTTLAAPCAAPTGLAATNITDADADLSWNTASGATGYEYVVDQAAGSPAGAGTATTTTTFSPTGLTASTVYYLHVRTNCGSGNFSPWTTISFTTLAAPCAAPTGLAATNVTDATADLSWNTVPGATGYEYVVDQAAGSPAGAGTATTTTTFSPTGLTASTVYYLHVRTNCGSGNFSPWTTISFTTLAAPCAAPTGLAATNITDAAADLSWTTQAGVTGYEYVVDQVSTSPAGAGTATTTTTFSPTGLTASTVYYLHVRTDCGGGNFSPWTTISFTTLAAPCAAPTGLAATNVTDAAADLSWTAQAGVTGYEYVVDQVSTSPVSAGTATTATTFNQTGLTASTVYYLHVRTNCGSGNFSPWTTISFTTLVTPCAAPTGLAATNVTDATADLSWNTVSGATGYEYVVDQVSADPSGAGTATTATTVNQTGLTASTVYYLHVRTNCGGGNFSPWTTISFTTLVTPCAAPTGLAATNITDAAADLSWTAQAGITGYEYVVDQVSTSPAGAGTATTATTVNQTGLMASTVYYLHVRTNCGSGNFSPWTTISFTTLVTPCAVPTGLAATNITDAAADLSWTAQAGVTGYEYVVDQAAGSPAGAGTATAATTFNQTGLTASTVYYLHVRTNCGSGNFSPWTTISFTTLAAPCAAPTGLAATNITDAAADLSWTAQAGVTGYEYVVDQAAGSPVSAGTATTATTVNQTGLSASTVYYLHVRTNCGSGNFSPWTTISFTTLVTPCAAPTGLAATNITDAAADLSWTAQAGVSAYDYVVDQNAGDPSTGITTTTGTTSNQTGLSAGTTYYLHVRTDCGAGNFSDWTTITFTTLPSSVPCAEPTGLTVLNITHNSATLAWTFQAGMTGYEYVVDQSSADPAGSGTGTSVNSGSASGLTALTTYYVHVRSNCGNGNFSDWVTVTFTTLSGIGLEEQTAILFDVYPNPATEKATIRANGSGVLTLINLKGQELWTQELHNQTTIDLSGLESGLYFVQYVQNGTMITAKLIKE